ncbi:carboxypeptidase regulatory-like domain-containing protein [bacterium]|nr:carboxypeptidase regulatory-like domain-containing protein [candidate division CSSED10-310 bacterium]
MIYRSTCIYLWVLFFLTGSGSAFDACGVNLLANPGFESGNGAPSDWTTFPPAPPGVTYLWDNTTSHSGSYCVSIESAVPEPAMWRQIVPVDPNEIYTFCGFIDLENVVPAAECCHQVIFRNAANEILKIVEIGSHNGTISWMSVFPHEMYVQAPADAATGEINLLIQGEGLVRFDDVHFGPAPQGGFEGFITLLGQPLENALVEIVGSGFTTTSDSIGKYSLEGIPLGSPRYQIQVSADGCRTAAVGDLTVRAGEIVSADIELLPGEDLNENFLHVIAGRLCHRAFIEPPEISTDAVIDPNLYPDSVKIYLESSAEVDSDHPAIIALADAILTSLDPADRTKIQNVTRAAYEWTIQNIDYDPHLTDTNFTDTTNGAWQTVEGTGWCWGLNFTDWLYKPSEMLQNESGICIEHSRFVTALVRALGIPARPVMSYSSQFWVQLPTGEGYWAGMCTNSGRSQYRISGDMTSHYGNVTPMNAYLVPIDSGPIIHSDWITDRKCRFREVHPWTEDYESSPEGLDLARSDMEQFGQTGEPPAAPPGPAPTEDRYSILYSDITLDFANIGNQRMLVMRFPMAVESDAITDLDETAYWTNYPSCVTGTWIDEQTNPPVVETLRWFCIQFDLSAVLPPRTCDKTGVRIEMPSDMYHPGDTCYCRVDVCNNDPVPLEDHPLFVILDVYGTCFFAPGFTTDYDNYISLHPSYPFGVTTVEVLPAFIWPEGAGQADGIVWYAALTDPYITSIYGEWDSFAFGWSN